jgi:hypothetical protein
VRLAAVRQLSCVQVHVQDASAVVTREAEPAAAAAAAAGGDSGHTSSDDEDGAAAAGAAAVPVGFSCAAESFDRVLLDAPCTGLGLCRHVVYRSGSVLSTVDRPAAATARHYVRACDRVTGSIPEATDR